MLNFLSVLRLSLASFLTLSTALSAQTQSSPNVLKLDKKDNMPKCTIADVAWIAGQWIGTGLGGDTEEIWSPPLGNSMMGAFRLVKNGKVVFQEICTIVEEDGSVVLKVKHFDANLKGWEEKDVSVNFPLVKLEDSTAYFDGATFRKTKDGSLEVFVLIKKKTGELKEERFVYRPR
jgi:hypothetical protein